MNRHAYFIGQAMNLPIEYLEAVLKDEDMKEDPKGCYIRGSGGGYYVPQSFDPDNFAKKYSIATSADYRLARRLVEIADAIHERLEPKKTMTYDGKIRYFKCSKCGSRMDWHDAFGELPGGCVNSPGITSEICGGEWTEITKEE